jgi:hypothetical protein
MVKVARSTSVTAKRLARQQPGDDLERSAAFGPAPSERVETSLHQRGETVSDACGLHLSGLGVGGLGDTRGWETLGP